jgi:HPt (histidine-containing phosphotransfer) domain-containing protein
MDGHLAKPFTQEALLQAVGQAAVRSDDPKGRYPATNNAPLEAASSLAPSPAAFVPDVGADLVIFNPTKFVRTSSFLEPQIVAAHLSTLAERSESLLSAITAMGVPPAGAEALAAASHTLAGSAGMFGFERLAAVAARFEYASKAAMPELPILVSSLTAAITASVQEMRHRAPVPSSQPGAEVLPA